MFNDLEDSTAITTRLGDQAGARSSIPATASRRHFALVSDAVACAQSIQRELAEFNETDPVAKMHVRIGLAAGEPVEADKDLFDSAVQLAARICAAAEPGPILAHDTIRGQCGILGTRFADAHPQALKGFEQPVMVSGIRWRPERRGLRQSVTPDVMHWSNASSVHGSAYRDSTRRFSNFHRTRHTAGIPHG